jgi:hypothetical protein
MKKNIIILSISVIILLISMFIKPKLNNDNIVINVKSFSTNNTILNKIPSTIKEKYKYNVVLNYVNDSKNADLIVAHESLVEDEYKKKCDLLRISEDNVIILNDKESLDFNNKTRDNHVTLVSKEVENYFLKKNDEKLNFIVSDNLADKAVSDKNIIAVMFESELKDFKEQRYLSDLGETELNNFGEKDFFTILINKDFKLKDEIKICINSILDDEEKKNSEK